MAAKPILYSYFRSSASWRVRFALALKGVEYEYRAVEIVKKKEQHDQQYKKLNPKMEVPVLVIDGLELSQSVPIIEYLDETRPKGPKLVPTNTVKRYQARSLAEIVNAGIQPYQNVPVLKMIGEEKKDEWLKYFLGRGLEAFEKTLRATSGKYCVGDDLTIADLCLAPQVYAAVRFNVNIDSFENIKRVNEALSKLPEFKASHPSTQPDCPPEFR